MKVFFITIDNFARKLLKNPFFRVAAVIFIVLACELISTTIAGSFNNNNRIFEEDTIVRNGSFIYADEYLNPHEIIIEESYDNGNYYEDENIVIQSSAFLAYNSPSLASVIAGQRNNIIEYEVQQGDIPSGIATAFDISTNTLLWANNLSPWSKIKPGQKLIILPVSGIKYTIKKGDTIESIIKKYKGEAEETIAFNGLPANGNLTIGQDIIIPDGQKPVEYVPRSSYAYYSVEELGPYGEDSHKFPWGQCTWYVAQKRYIPWNGDAKTWLKKAIAFGFETGTEPKVGAIVSTREHWLYGHVAYVEAVTADTITVSEMSLGFGIRRVRTLNRDDWRILGYIY